MQNTTLTKKPTELNEPTLDILEEGLLHKLMLVFHLPTRLPGLLVVALALVLVALTGLAWWLVTADTAMAELVAALLALFMAADMTLLLTLPQQKVSYGPWKAQLFVLAMPRLALITSYQPRWLALTLTPAWYSHI